MDSRMSEPEVTLQSSFLQWQHKSQQIKRLQLLLKRSYVPDMLIFGPSCTGKTSIVRELVAGRQHAYISCSKSLKLRSLLSSTVSQLSQNSKRKRNNAYAGASGTETSLIWELKALCPVGQPSCVVVLDDMQQLLSASDGPLAPLLALRGQAAVNIALVMISKAQPAALGLLTLLPGLVTVPFPTYTDIELVNILAAAGPPSPTQTANGQQQQQQQREQQEQQQMYRRFLNQRIVKDFTPHSRYLPDLASQAAALWPKYLAAARLAVQQHDADGEGQEGDADVDHESRIYGAIKQRLESSIAAFQPAACVTLAALNSATATGQQQRVGLSGGHMAAGLEMCRMSKLLLIAAFLASRNKPSVDKQLFEDSSGWRKRGGRRKNVMGADRQAEAAKAAEMKGPHTFSLPRLLQVYSSLLRADENHSSSSSQAQQQQQQQHQQDKLAEAGGWLGVRTANVLMGINSLVTSRLLTKACDDVLEAPRFGCEAPQDFVEQIAVDMGVPLSSYLKYV